MTVAQGRAKWRTAPLGAACSNFTGGVGMPRVSAHISPLAITPQDGPTTTVSSIRTFPPCSRAVVRKPKTLRPGCPSNRDVRPPSEWIGGEGRLWGTKP